MGKEELKKEDLTQAVVIADNFNNSFQPLTSSLPSCLLPLAGRPLLEYTLQCLAHSGVQDVIIYLTNNSAKVKEWLKSSQFRESYCAAPFSVTCITNEDCRSFGDGMRDLYEKGVLRNDFILVSGDLVSNLNLAPFLATHRENFKKDKHSIMTAVYSQAYQGHPLRRKGGELILATDKESKQILFYQRSNTKSANFPVELFQHEEVEIIFDILDPNIYICSPIVPALFSDNFDIQDMDTMMNEILDSELVDSTIYLTIDNSGFCCRAENPYLYGQVYQKVLNRWVYPIVPDRKAVGGTAGEEGVAEKISLQASNVYRSSTAQIHRGTVLGQNTFIGGRVEVSTGCTVQGSALEYNCTVGKSTSISGSIIMKNTKIGEGCVLQNCIVGENVEIPANCVLQDRVLLGHGVVVKEGSKVPSSTRLSSVKSSDGFSDDEGEEKEEEGEYGPKAFVYQEEGQDEEEEDEDPVAAEDLWGEAFATSDESEAESEDWEEEDEEREEVEEDDLDGINEHDDVKNFRREVRDSLVRADEEGINTDNLVLEINSSKHAWNTTLCEVNQCVLECVLTLNLSLDQPPAKLLAGVKGNIVKYKSLLLKYSKSKSGQEYYLSIIPELINRTQPFTEIIAKVLHILYDLDILGEVSILSWAGKLQDASLKKRIAPFLEWLEEEESGSDEDEE